MIDTAAFQRLSRSDAFILELERRYQIFAETRFSAYSAFPKYPSIRMFQYRDDIIIYDPLPDGAGLELIRILNAARDYHRYFDD